MLAPHENIIRLRFYAAESDIDDEGTRLLSLFMDFLPSNLQFLIRDYGTGMPLSLIRVYSRQLLAGLAHLADRNIVHRDLLPRNILINPSKESLKLADFGCAKIISPDIPNYPNVGTWQYRALELLLGATHYTPQAGTHLQCISDSEIFGLRR
jgi:serine/threonine protein kinase